MLLLSLLSLLPLLLLLPPLRLFRGAPPPPRRPRFQPAAKAIPPQSVEEVAEEGHDDGRCRCCLRRVNEAYGRGPLRRRHLPRRERRACEAASSQTTKVHRQARMTNHLYASVAAAAAVVAAVAAALRVMGLCAGDAGAQYPHTRRRLERNGSSDPAAVLEKTSPGKTHCRSPQISSTLEPASPATPRCRMAASIAEVQRTSGEYGFKLMMLLGTSSFMIY